VTRARLRDSLAFAVTTLVVLGAVRTLHNPSGVMTVAVVGLALIGVWIFTTEHYERSLLVLLLYLGLLDGYLKLSTGSQVATLGRDVLLYAICIGIIARGIIRNRPLPAAPPLTGWIVLLVGVAIVQVANPDGHGIAHSLASLRPHLEFVPLFFLGYAVMRSANRLRWMCIALMAIAVANGAVGVVQSNLTPDQLAQWGPGYNTRLNGGGGAGAVAPETYSVNGVSHVRPPALGSDAGFGGVVGDLAIPAALALITLSSRPGRRWLLAPGLLGFAGAVVAVATSAARVAVLAALVSVAAYLALTVASRRLVPTMASLAIGVAITMFALSQLAAGSSQGSIFARYDTIAPDKLFTTASQARGSSLALAPSILAGYPLGAGLGSVGPATNEVGGSAGNLNGENEFNFLIVELGLPGLLVVIGFTVRVLAMTIRVRRVHDPDLQPLLAAFAAPLFAMAVEYFGNVPTDTSPTSPFLWLATGTLAFWLLSRPDTVG
jgi:hypothetical protein